MIRIILWNMSNDIYAIKTQIFVFFGLIKGNPVPLEYDPVEPLTGGLEAGNAEAAGELRAEREASTLARCQANAGREEVEDGEDNRGDGGDNDDFLDVRDLTGDDNHRHRDGKTLKEILNSASQEFCCRKAVHLFLYSGSTK